MSVSILFYKTTLCIGYFGLVNSKQIIKNENYDDNRSFS